MNYIHLSEIKVDQERLRKDMGDLDSLISSIRDNASSLVDTKGLMHPIVLDADNNLIAGGRRLAAFTTLSKSDKVFEEIPYTRVESLSPAKRRMLEVEENIRRHPMSWQENIVGIADFHRLSQLESFREGDKWSQSATAEIFNLSQAAISNTLELARVLKREPDSPIAKADNVTQAIQLLAKRKLDEASQEQLRRIELRRQSASTNLVLAKAEVPIEVIDASRIHLPNQKPVTNLLTNDQIASFYFHGSCLELIPEIAKTQVINHIICDPPFGIDMDNLSAAEGKIDRVSDTHQVKDNIQLIEAFLDVGYRHIAEDGFLCMWYDLDHHEKIRDWAVKIGWRVTRWPLVWCKSSNCSNNQAQYNVTKATEVCYFLRRSEKSIIKQKQSKNWIIADAVRDPTHPFVKPPEVWNYLIDTVSVEGNTILDGFAGQGSSLVQFFKRNRVPIGCEIDQTHIANGINYIQARLGKKDEIDVSGLLSEMPL